MYSFPNLEPVRCSMSSSICCFLTCIQISQEAGKVVWYSHLLKNFPQFVVIHTVKGFGIVSEAEVDVFLEFSCFFDDSTDVGNLISGISKSCQFQNFSEIIWGNWLNLVGFFFFFHARLCGRTQASVRAGSSWDRCLSLGYTPREGKYERKKYQSTDCSVIRNHKWDDFSLLESTLSMESIIIDMKKIKDK